MSYYPNNGTIRINPSLSPRENLMVLIRNRLGDEIANRVISYQVRELYNIFTDQETKQFYGCNTHLELNLDNPNHELPDYFEIYYNRLETGFNFMNRRSLIYSIKRYGEFTGHEESDNLRLSKMVEESGFFSMSEQDPLLTLLVTKDEFIRVIPNDNNPVYHGHYNIPFKVVP